VYQFISQLIRRNRELLQDNNRSDTNASDDDIRAVLTTQAIAQNALRRQALYKSNYSTPLQVVIVGPTQVGKSTVANILLRQNLAESSARAGFTVHCQGFHVVAELKDRYNCSESQGNDGQGNDSQCNDNWATEYFGELQQAPQKTLDRQVLSEYSLQETLSPDSPFTDTVIWDTPDFDSIRSFDYRAPLTKALTLADLVVFVVSKDKYADKTVWIMLELLASLNASVVIVMNKTPQKVRAELKASIENKYRSALEKSAPKKSTVPEINFIGEYSKEQLAQTAPLIAEEELAELQQNIKECLQRASQEDVKNNTLGFIRNHWSLWTAGVSAEHQLQAEYRELVEKVAAETLQRYRSEYIDSDRHREVIQLALSELLVLLEVPGMAKPLSKIRSVVTWPVRTLIGAAKEPSPVSNDDRNEERRFLDELGKHATATLIASIARKESGTDGLWWSQMREQVTGAESEIKARYNQSLDNYQTMLQVEIDRAAQSLYQVLQEQPATLNGLRAARVTADAAAVVLAVKSGGLGAVDLVVAPAMLSLTTLLTEGALGKYMQRIQKKLTSYQQKEVQSVIDRKIAKPFLQLEQNIARDESISEDELQRMTVKLEAGDV